MRIIDKNTDFYDYLQNVYRDDSVTYDRTDSFIVTKKMLCDHLETNSRWNGQRQKNRFVLLQVCNTFWLFLVEITKFVDAYCDLPKDYTVRLIHSWKNYDKDRWLIKLDIIAFGWQVMQYVMDRNYLSGDISHEKLEKNADKLIQAVDLGDFVVKDSINKHEIYYSSGDFPKKVEKHIPLLIACGIGNCIDPLEMYLSTEEFFSLEKQSAERTESIGLTDVEKAENHGFDRKISFRGKA